MSSLSKSLLKEMKREVEENIKRSVARCASEYGFDVTLALEMLGIREEKASGIELPFIREGVDMEGCNGLSYNHGLFTQCKKRRDALGEYCKSCLKDVGEDGLPKSGTISRRLETGLMEYRDGKNRRPVAYQKVMERNKWSREAVEGEAGKLNLKIDEIHYALEEKKVRAGRPKVEKKRVMVALEGEDLFARLASELGSVSSELGSVSSELGSVSSELGSEEESGSEEEVSLVLKSIVDKVVKTGKKKTKKPANESEKQAKDEKLALEKQAKDEKLASEKLAKEEKLETLALEK